MLAISLIASLGLAFMIKKIDHHVKFIPIIAITILIYAIAKIYHLPSLIFILIFGLFLNNLDELNQFKFINKLNPKKLDLEIREFSKLIAEITFLTRTIFYPFWLYNYFRCVAQSRYAAVCIRNYRINFILESFSSEFLKTEFLPLLFIAPRGLITIMLFLSSSDFKKNRFYK